jgi:hypothetical protein
MTPDRIESRTATLCADLAALGIPTDNLGCGVVDLMIDRRDGERHGEMRLVVAEDGESVTLCTVWYALDEDGGEHPVDDTEHEEHNVFDSEGVAISIREITGGAA